MLLYHDKNELAIELVITVAPYADERSARLKLYMWVKKTSVNNHLTISRFCRVLLPAIPLSATVDPLFPQPLLEHNNLNELQPEDLKLIVICYLG